MALAGIHNCNENRGDVKLTIIVSYGYELTLRYDKRNVK